MKFILAARKSHLARLQAHTVGAALQKVVPNLEIDYRFRESLGDINLNDPLWKMPEKGVFTQDFVEDLRQGRCDLVVHSWKDLPLGVTPGTRIVATLPREDSRDLLLMRNDKWREFMSSGGPVEILTSSPRRTYNLAPFLKTALPGSVTDIQFSPVRGNIPTRLSKLMSGSSHGLILAKAALDRLLEAPQEEFSETAQMIRGVLRECRFMVLPLSMNPTAAAQGALAVEVADKAKPELLAALAQINCPVTFETVLREREILGSYGGGCHQKIGVSVLRRPYGEITSLRGLTDGGQVLDTRELVPAGSKAAAPVPASQLFPLDPKDSSFFDRILESPAKPGARAFWVARADAWPESWKASESDVIWTAGLESWRKLAARGLWVNGSSEGLGESESTQLAILMGESPRWTKLSHDEGVRSVDFDFYPTYQLKAKPLAPNLRGKTHFYWMSGSAFMRALELSPEIKKAQHASGPGHTSALLRAQLGESNPPAVFLSHSEWLKTYLAP